MHISILGVIIYVAYLITGNASSLTSLEGYPSWYQDMVTKEAAKLADQDQLKIIQN